MTSTTTTTSTDNITKSSSDESNMIPPLLAEAIETVVSAETLPATASRDVFRTDATRKRFASLILPQTSKTAKPFSVKPSVAAVVRPVETTPQQQVGTVYVCIYVFACVCEPVRIMRTNGCVWCVCFV